MEVWSPPLSLTYHLDLSLAQSITSKMAEPLGIIADTIGISSAFTTRVDCFEYIQLGRHFGRDIQTDLLALSCARLRLTPWVVSVHTYDGLKLGRPDATAAEIRTAKDTLLQILALSVSTEGDLEEVQADSEGRRESRPLIRDRHQPHDCCSGEQDEIACNPTTEGKPVLKLTRN
jgi:Prion-inhibition and propagation